MNGRLEYELRIENGIEAKLNRMPPYCKDWFLNLKASDKTAATCRTYIDRIYGFLEYINADVKLVKISDINRNNVTSYYTSIKTKKDEDGNLAATSDSYQQLVWSSLHLFFDYLVEIGEMETNLIALIKKPKNRDLPRINQHRILLTKDDFKKIIQATKHATSKKSARDTAILMIFMTTGMRRSALANININDIDFENHVLTVIDKGDIRHEYILNDSTEEAIKNWMSYRTGFKNADNSSALFMSNKGNRISTDAVYDAVEKYCYMALGKKISPHKLRSGFCSIMYDQTHDIEFVRRAVGHSNVSTTQRYIVTGGEERKKVAVLMDDLT